MNGVRLEDVSLQKIGRLLMDKSGRLGVFGSFDFAVLMFVDWDRRVSNDESVELGAAMNGGVVTWARNLFEDPIL